MGACDVFPSKMLNLKSSMSQTFDCSRVLEIGIVSVFTLKTISSWILGIISSTVNSKVTFAPLAGDEKVS